MAFTVYTADTRPDGLSFSDQDAFWFEGGGVLAVNSTAEGVRYYAPGQWQEVQYKRHLPHLRPIPQMPMD